MSRYMVITGLIILFISTIFVASIGRAAPAPTSNQFLDPSTITATSTISLYLPIVTNNPFYFFDTFHDPDSGWPTGDSGNVKLSYQDGEYEILIRPETYWGATVPQLDDISNYTIAAGMRIPDGKDGYYGLIFDRQDWDHFYLFIVSPNGQYYAVLVKEFDWKLLTGFTYSPAINSGAATNHLRVGRFGSQIAVYVNDQHLTTLSHDKYTGSFNEVGLFAQSLTNVPVAMRFDNFSVLLSGSPPDRRPTSFVGNPAVLHSEGDGFLILAP